MAISELAWNHPSGLRSIPPCSSLCCVINNYRKYKLIIISILPRHLAYLAPCLHATKYSSKGGKVDDCRVSTSSISENARAQAVSWSRTTLRLFNTASNHNQAVGMSSTSFEAFESLCFSTLSSCSRVYSRHTSLRAI